MVNVGIISKIYYFAHSEKKRLFVVSKVKDSSNGTTSFRFNTCLENMRAMVHLKLTLPVPLSALTNNL